MDNMALESLCKLTLELVKIRHATCNHLCVENIGPEILQKLILAYEKKFEVDG